MITFVLLAITVWGALAIPDDRLPSWVQNNPKINVSEIARLQSYYDLYANLTNPYATDGVALPPVNPDGSLNLAVFPDFKDWDCAAYRGQGEYECNVDRCKAVLQVRNFTTLQTGALCGSDWRQKGEIKIEPSDAVVTSR